MKKICRPLNLEAVNTHRKESCLHYDGCLEEASALLWPSFSCEGCKLYMEKTAEPVCYDRAASPLAWEI
ncbi:MAG: hypothetical protein GY854_16870 [Deltaproteobacteria bacterium]|nr:hypothetical protein [Deltaproteobacteria bacterium]